MLSTLSAQGPEHWPSLGRASWKRLAFLLGFELVVEELFWRWLKNSDKATLLATPNERVNASASHQAPNLLVLLNAQTIKGSGALA